MSAEPTTTTPATAVSPKKGTMDPRVGPVMAELFMPHYLVPNTSSKGKGATTKGEAKEAIDEVAIEPIGSLPSAILSQITNSQDAAIESLKESNNKLRAFALESDRMMPPSSSALFQHVNLVAAVRKELETLEARVGRCLQRAERIKAHDDEQAIANASHTTITPTSVGSPSSLQQQLGSFSTGGASSSGPTAAEAEDDEVVTTTADGPAPRSTSPTPAPTPASTPARSQGAASPKPDDDEASPAATTDDAPTITDE